MLAPAPKSVQQAWGEVVTRDVTGWLEDSMAEQTVHRDEWEEVKTRLTIVEHDLVELKTEMREFRREVNERFDRLTERIDRVIGQFDERFDRQSAEMNARFDGLQRQMASQTRWTVGTLALFCSLIAAMLAITQFKP